MKTLIGILFVVALLAQVGNAETLNCTNSTYTLNIIGGEGMYADYQPTPPENTTPQEMTEEDRYMALNCNPHRLIAGDVNYMSGCNCKIENGMLDCEHKFSSPINLCKFKKLRENDTHLDQMCAYLEREAIRCPPKPCPPDTTPFGDSRLFGAGIAISLILGMWLGTKLVGRSKP